MQKQCNACKEVKPLTDFSKISPTSNSFRSQCKTCRSNKAREHYENNIEHSRHRSKVYQREHPECGKQKRQRDKERNIWRTYYWTNKQRQLKTKLPSYQEILEGQNGCCAICGTPASSIKRNLALDHDHITGKPRGLLCGHCNTGIGFLQDDPSTLRKAADYIEKYQEAKKK